MSNDSVFILWRDISISILPKEGLFLVRFDQVNDFVIEWCCVNHIWFQDYVPVL